MTFLLQVITHEEAERRGRIYDAECRTYLFDLDFNGDDSPFIVDAGFYGNESHFVNHSVGISAGSLQQRLSFAPCSRALGGVSKRLMSS